MEKTTETRSNETYDEIYESSYSGGDAYGVSKVRKSSKRIEDDSNKMIVLTVGAILIGAMLLGFITGFTRQANATAPGDRSYYPVAGAADSHPDF